MELDNLLGKRVSLWQNVTKVGTKVKNWNCSSSRFKKINDGTYAQKWNVWYELCYNLEIL
jgi:hypothetical protein